MLLAPVVWLLTVIICYFFIAQTWWFPPPISQHGIAYDAQFMRTLIVVGIVFSLAARLGIVHRLPTLPVVVTGGWMLRAAIIAIVGAIAGALYPAYKAAQKDPIDALAYE